MKLITDYETYVEISTPALHKTCLLDSDDYMRLCRHNVQTLSCAYSVAKERHKAIKIWINNKSVLLHRWITKCPDHLQVDHINKDVFDNRKENLRIVTNRENQHNRVGQSRIIGAYRNNARKSLNSWIARIQINRKTKHLGAFKTQEEAGIAYQKALKELL